VLGLRVRISVWVRVRIRVRVSEGLKMKWGLVNGTELLN
jgi:hypothetical protein